MDIAVMAGQLLAPVVLATEDQSHLWRLLNQLAAAADVDDVLAARFKDLAGAADLEQIVALIRALDDPDDPREPGEIVAALVPPVQRVLTAVRSLASLTDASVAGLIAPMNDPATWRELAELLPEYLLGRFLGDQHPVLAAALALLATTRDVTMPDGNGYQLLELDALRGLVADPPGHVSGAYRWGGRFDYVTAVKRVEDLLAAMGCPVQHRTGDDGMDRLDISLVEGRTSLGYARLVAEVGPAFGDQGTADGLAVSFSPFGDASGAGLSDTWALSAGAPAAGDLAAVTVQLRPSGVTVTGPDPALTLTGRPAVPFALLGSPDATRLELAEASVEATAAAGDAQVVARLGDTDAGTGLRLVLGAAGVDSFLASLLGGDVAADACLTLAWSVRDGFSFAGSAEFSATITIERAVGPVWLHRLTIALDAGTGGLDLLLTVALSADIGPVEAAIDGIGLHGSLVAAADGTTGMLGSLDLAVALQPPNGVGLGLDLSVVSGGGYLVADAESGSYAGVLDLEILAVRVDAIGIIDTHPPDADGWSMFFALYLSVPSIQLGFGFALTGVGGLAGVNRAVDADALGDAVRSGSLDSVLFPKDPVASAPFIIDQLRGIFPPSPGRYVFGPVVRIAWGTPSLIEAEVGVVITLPDPITIAVVGALTSVLPTEDVDVIDLHLNVAGVIDFGAGTVAIDASLHDSHVLQYGLSGDMALRASFGTSADFLMALGGVHPGFDDVPAGFPALRPLSLAISAAPVLSIDFDCYLALASNSVQFGATFAVAAEVEGFGIEGNAQFDALIGFSPFEFSASLGFHVTVTAAGLDLAGVWLDLDLTGPNPWYVVATAEFKAFGLDQHIRLDQRIGTRQQETTLPPADLHGLVLAALTAPEAWRAVDTPGGEVLLADAGPAPPDGQGDAGLPAMPDGLVAVSQRVLPLGIRLEQAGDDPVGPYHTFQLTAAATDSQPSEPVTDWFAPGAFFALSPAEKLAAPSFELLDAGIQFGGGPATGGPARTASVGYEQILRDPELSDADTRTADGAGRGVQIAATRGAFLVAEDPSPVRVVPGGVAVTGRRSGAVLGRAATWSAAHQSAAGRDVATTLSRSWEPLAAAPAAGRGSGHGSGQREERW